MRTSNLQEVLERAFEVTAIIEQPRAHVLASMQHVVLHIVGGNSNGETIRERISDADKAVGIGVFIGAVVALRLSKRGQRLFKRYRLPFSITSVQNADLVHSLPSDAKVGISIKLQTIS